MVAVVDLLSQTAAIGWGQKQFPALGLCLQSRSGPEFPPKPLHSSRSRGT